ncbi:MAG: hypothetical protein K1X66_03425 [Verrucomicrobiae bacterium]|nr:hypothetical protein [Verrucomicrobiae bacterium]
MKPSSSSASSPHVLVLHLHYLQSGDVVEGQLSSDLLEIPEFHPTTPLSYHLNVSFEKDEVLVHGSLQLSGQAPCSRCLADLPINLKINDFTVLAPKKQDTIDLTNFLKEDILLAIPSYPKCELDAEGRCPVTGKNWKAVWQSTEASPPLSNEWSKLDKLKKKD